MTFSLVVLQSESQPDSKMICSLSQIFINLADFHSFSHSFSLSNWAKLAQ